MAKQLFQIIPFVGVPAAGMVTLPHDIGDFGHDQAYIPDEAELSNGDFEILSTTDVSVTVRNNGAAPGNCFVLLKLEHSLTRALGPDTSFNNSAGSMTPRPFIPAAGGGGGGGTGVIYDFVFQPGGVAGPNVYTTYAATVAAANAVGGRKRIFYDNTFLPCVIPAGAYDVTNILHCAPFGQTLVEVQEGVVFTGFRQMDQGCLFNFTGATPPVSDLGANGIVTFSGGGGVISTGTGPFFDVANAGAFCVFVFDLGSTMVGPDNFPGAIPSLRLSGAGSGALVITGERANVNGSTIEGIVGTTIISNVVSSSGFISELQPAFLGTFLSQNGTQAQFNTPGVKTGNYTASINEIVECDPTGGTFTVTLPAVFNNRGKWVEIKNITASNIAVVVAAGAGDNIDGNATVSIIEAFGSLYLNGNGDHRWNIVSADGSVGPDTIYSFVYRAAGTNTGNDFSDWASLVTAVAAVPGKKQVFFPDPVTNNIPAGTWDFANTTWLGQLDGQDRVTTIVSFTNNGTVITGLREIGANLRLQNETNATVINDLGDGGRFVIADHAMFDGEDGTAAIVSLSTGGGTTTFDLVNGGKITNSPAGSTCIDLAGNNAIVLGGVSSVLGENAITLGGGGLTAVFRASSADLAVTQDGGVATMEVDIAARLSPLAVEGNTAVPINTLVEASPGGGNVNITLPAIVPATGDASIGAYVLVRQNGAGTVTILASGADTINGLASYQLTNDGQILYLTNNGVGRWIIVAAAPNSQRQTFRYTADGTELAAGFTVTLPVARASASYTVNPSLEDVALHFQPAFPLASKTTTDFVCVPDINLTAGDTILFTVEDLT